MNKPHNPKHPMGGCNPNGRFCQHELETVSTMAIQRCPKDEETLGWHLFVHDVNGEGKLLTNGDMIGCDFGKDDVEEKENDRNRSRTLEARS